MMRLLGDIHGNHLFYGSLLAKSIGKSTLQVGDFGLGFRETYDNGLQQALNSFAGVHKFIRGNHDNPRICTSEPFRKYHLPDWGYDSHTGIFWLGGAYSIDWRYRVPGVSWWDDEELSPSQLHAAIEEYRKVKPRFVVTHDCPASLYPRVLQLAQRDKDVARTSQALDAMLAYHSPEKWYFGHMHVRFSCVESGTTFRCLNINEWVDDYDIPDWNE